MVLSPSRKTFFQSYIREFFWWANCHVCFLSTYGRENNPSWNTEASSATGRLSCNHSGFDCHYKIPISLLLPVPKKSGSCVNRLIPFLAHFHIKVSNGHVWIVESNIYNWIQASRQSGNLSSDPLWGVLTSYVFLLCSRLLKF